MSFLARIIETEEKIVVYRLQNGNYYDRANMSEALPPNAQKAGKKEFSPEEVEIIKEV